ncbi:hypothetical protein [Longimicrobium sp.]|uniref:hypothetical protein n=1 Tax=Longimicrobium sp. TaxID=2029185 RepID=UPI002C2481F9|nr:hypothetical protein [Longimicrobium sp.]HSU17266.1 hypothetical protein [Longimicrobium sp.]
MSDDPFSDVAEFDDDAAYDWWRSAHPDGFVLAVRARKPPMLHRAGCREIDRGEHPGRLKAKGSRQVCAEMKSALRAWAARELETQGLIERCPKCGP